MGTTDPPMAGEPREDLAMTDTGNVRVDRLLDTARRYGHNVRPSRVVTECWIIALCADASVTLTVYAARNHSARVYLSAPWDKDWQLVTQRRAFHLMTSF